MKNYRDAYPGHKILVPVMVIILIATPTLAGWSFPGTGFVTRQGKISPIQASISAGTLPTGSVDDGEKLFMGEIHFQNGGPPCMGCHNIDSLGLLGGGILGPDLTGVSDYFGEDGLAQFLAYPPGPTMKPIFFDHPLTSPEQADLLVFLQSTAGQPIANHEYLIFTLSLAGVVVAAGLFGFLYRNRLRAVRNPLVKGASPNGQEK